MFTGVPALETADVTRVSLGVSKKLWPAHVAPTPDKLQEDGLIAWCSSDVMSTQGLQAILRSLHAAAVMDLTPGPTAAKFCLQNDIPYTGLMHNDEGKEWLETLLDMEALKSLGASYFTGSQVKSCCFAVRKFALCERAAWSN